jgi:diaminopimelate decarboxylase
MTKPMGAIPPASARTRACCDRRPAVPTRWSRKPATRRSSSTISTLLSSSAIAPLPRRLSGVELHYAIKANPYAPLAQTQLRSRSTARRRLGRRAARSRSRRDGAEHISFAGPGKRDASSKPRSRRASRSTASPKARRSGRLHRRRGPPAAARRAGQSGFRDQGLGHAHGRRRQAVRRRCRARAGAGPPHHRSGRRLARLPHLRRLAGARRRSADRGAAGDARARRRACRSGGAARRWSISAAASAFPISTASSRSTSSGRRSARSRSRATAPNPCATAASRSSSAAGWSARRGLSDPHRRPEGQPRQDLPGHRRRHAPPARRVRQFRPGGPPQLSGRDRQPLRRAPAEEASIVGCLCTPLDRLADDVMLPRAEVGDLVAVFLAGAYGLSASPQAFSASSRRAKCWSAPAI